jgi:hypothetical protein
MTRNMLSWFHYEATSLITATGLIGIFDLYVTVVYPSCDGDVLVLLKYGGWILHIDVDGKLVCSHHRGFGLAKLGLKQTLVSHTFFLTLEGYVVNAKLFIRQLLSEVVILYSGT